MRKLIGIALALASFAGVAHAQAVQQTFVSGVGDDANPCTRTAPCATFTAALANTLPGGEIDAIDPGDFGTVAITQAVTINGIVEDGYMALATLEGITIAAGATDVVTLRGVSIVGRGTGSGITVTSAGVVHIEQSWIAGFADGVLFTPAAGGQLFVDDVIAKDNSDAGFVAGSSGGVAAMTMNDSRAENNGVGIRAIAGGRIDVYDCDASNNSVAGVSSELDGNGGNAEINLESVDASQNGIGVRATATAGSAIVRLSKVLGTDNATAPVLGSGNGELLSFGNNRLDVVPALVLSTTTPSQSVNAGAPAIYPLDVEVTGLLSDPITFTCSGLPAGATCNFSPATLVGITTGATTLTITTTSPTGPDSGAFVWPKAPPTLPWLVVFLAVLVAMARQPRLRRSLGVAVALPLFVAGLVTLASCERSSSKQDMGGNNGEMSVNNGEMSVNNDMSVNDLSTPDLLPPFTPTPPGTYAITVTATSGSLTSTLPLSLIVAN